MYRREFRTAGRSSRKPPDRNSCGPKKEIEAWLMVLMLTAKRGDQHQRVEEDFRYSSTTLSRSR